MKKRLLQTGLTLLLGLMTAVGQQQKPVPNGIVYAEGTKFYVSDQSGNVAPYYFTGTNNYYLMYKPKQMVTDILDAMVNLNMKVVRMWFFMDGENTHDGFNLQPAANMYNESGFQQIDMVVSEASKRNLKIIPVFVNFWQHFGGMQQYAQWAGGNAGDFYSNASMKAIYKNYVAKWINRTNTITNVKYKDDPTILAWQLTNEGRCDQGKATQYVAWAKEMSDYIRTIDPYHMISMGDEGLMNYSYDEARALSGEITTDWPYAGGQGDWKGLLRLPNIDFGTIHNYATDNWGYNLAWGVQWTKHHIKVAHEEFNKPCVMEEYDKAYSGNWDFTKDQERATVMQAYIDIIEDMDMAGDCSWMLVGLNYTDPVEAGYHMDPNGDVEKLWLYRVKWAGDGHQYSAYDPYTAPVLREHGQRMLEKNTVSLPQSFTQSVPEASAVNVGITSFLQWETSPFATSYSVKVSTSPSMNNPVFTRDNISGTSCKLEGLNYSTVYYWTVTASNVMGAVAASNAGLSFTTQAVPAAVGDFTLLSPAADNTPLSSVGFSWTAASSADYYRLVVSTNSDLSSPFIDVTDLTNPSYTTEKTFSEGTVYHWQVTAYNSLSSKASINTLTFTTQLQNPEIDYFNSYADCAAMQGVWVRNTGGASITVCPAINVNFPGATQSMSMAYSFSSGGYCGVMHQSLGSKKFTGYNGIGFYLKGDNSGNELTIQFKEASGEYWESTQKITGNDVTWYKYNFTDFKKPGWQSDGNGVQDLGSISEVAIYLGGQGGSSTIYLDELQLSNTTPEDEMKLPQAFLQTIPANGAIDIGNDVTLQWNASLYATSYSIKLADNPAMTNPFVDVNNVKGTSYQVSGLSSVTTYYWQVTAHNSVGQLGATNQGSSFTTVSAPVKVGPFTIVSPATKETPTNGTSFVWNNAEGAQTYRLVVSQNSDLSSPVVNVAGIVGASYVCSQQLASNTVYYWQVIGVNGTANTRSSNTLSFITENTGAEIDFFNNYGDCGVVQNVWKRNTGGASITVCPAKNKGFPGNTTAMSLAYSFNSGGYCGVMHQSINGKSFAGYTGIGFYLIGDKSGNELTLQFKEASGEYWEATQTITGNSVTWYMYDFATFVKPGWQSDGNGVKDLDNIVEVAIYFGGNGGSNTIYMDQLQLANNYAAVALKVDTGEQDHTQEAFESIGFSIYPNPAKSIVTIRFNSLDSGASIRVFNVVGKLVDIIRLPESGEHCTWQVDALDKGIYLLELHGNVHKLIVK